MAVSLAHMSQEASRRRATTLPSSTPPRMPMQYNPSEIAPASAPVAPMAYPTANQPWAGAATPAPMPSQQRYSTDSAPPNYPASNQPWVGIPVAPMSYAPEQRYTYQPGAEYAQPAARSVPHAQQQPALQFHPPVELASTERPALPPRPDIQQHLPSSPHDSVHSTTASASPSSRPKSQPLEPDPLPPHSNPQALTTAQSAAFTSSTPLPSLNLGPDEIWSSANGLAEFRIIREAAHLPRKLSSKPLLTVTRTSDGQSIGSVKFHTFHSHTIELTLHPSGRKTEMSHSGFVHNRWGWTTLASNNDWERWYWKLPHGESGAATVVLETAKHKHGDVIARLEGERLAFVRGRLREGGYEEVVLSAVAVLEAGRRQSGN